MSEFSVIVSKVIITSHPNADKLELAQIGDYNSIVGKGQFLNGELVAYIPEQSIVPNDILKEMGLEGRLAGKQKNRVKAIRLRGILSQGLVYPARLGWNVGDDVSKLLGISKYEPVIPAALSGEVYSAGLDRTLKYDIENIKKYPRSFKPGESVIFTEKIHGTWSLFGLVPKHWEHKEHGRLVVSSKGLSSNGLALKPFTERNENNLYLRVSRYFSLENRIEHVFREQIEVEKKPVFIIGEIFGQGVQDLAYGARVSENHSIGFRIFDIFIGKPGAGRYLNDEKLDKACASLDIKRVPVLYRGPFWHSTMMDYTNGTETITGNKTHLREGIVIRPIAERKDNKIGRLQLKSISPSYLLRKSGTEYT